MRFVNVFCVVLGLCIVMNTVVRVSAAEADDDGEQTIEPHRTGKFEIVQRGLPAKLYLETQHEYGETLNADHVRRVKRGELEWLGDSNFEGGLTYKVYVPPSYEPDKPHGIYVHISPGNNGGVPGSYRDVLAKHRLIGIGANNSGNQVGTSSRHAYAVHAADMLRSAYSIDEDRIYVGGFSGGGRVASQVMMMNADVFDGGVPMAGANPVVSMEIFPTNGPRFMYESKWKRIDRNLLRRAAKEGRFIFATCENDSNLKNVTSVAEGYKKLGFQNVALFVEPDRGHAVLSGEWFAKAIAFLDAPLREAAEQHYEQAVRMHDRGAWGNAIELFQKAAAHGGDADWVPDAEARFRELRERYRKDVAAAEQAIEAVDTQALLKSLRTLRRAWGGYAREDVRDLTERFREARRTQANQ